MSNSFPFDLIIVILSLLVTAVLLLLEKLTKDKERYKSVWRGIMLALVLSIIAGLIEFKYSTKEKLSKLEKVSVASEMSNSIAEIYGHNNRFLTHFTENWRMKGFLADLSQLKGGNIQLKQEETFPVPTEWNDMAVLSINAVSFMESISEVWNSTAGDDYLKSFGNASERGVDARRVFIFKDSTNYNNYIAQTSLIKRHHRNVPEGTKVTLKERVLRDMEIRGISRQVSSILILDKELGGEISIKENKTPKEVRFSIEQTFIAELQDYFDRVWRIVRWSKKSGHKNKVNLCSNERETHHQKAS